MAEKRDAHTLSFEQVYQQYWSKLYIYGFRVLKDKSVVEDLVQEIFLSYWKKKDTLEVVNISAYLFQSLRFQIYKYYRDTKFKTLDIEKFSNIVSVNTADELLNLEDTKKLVNTCLDKLPKRCREIFYLSRFKNLSHKEISEELNISNQTVKNQMSIASKYLQEHYKELTFLLLLVEQHNFF
ncbi:MAG: RNA polymerase sigma-70 factor [Flavicella sp.]|nr:RNA polymerase sigma-70 factor [Flavicella sp.]